MAKRIRVQTDMRETFSQYKGSAVVAAATLSPSRGNQFNVTGNTGISHIRKTRSTSIINSVTRQAGSLLILQFTGTPTVANNAGTVPTGFAPILLSGAADAIMQAGSILVLVLGSTNWHELARSLAPTAVTGTATGFTAGAGTAVKDDSTFTGGVGSTAYRISDIVRGLKNAGYLLP